MTTHRRWTMNEGNLQAAVIEAAHIHGWLVAHFRGMQGADGFWRTPVAGDGKGFPDLVLASGDGRGVIFAELKGDDNRKRIAPEQAHWISTLQASGARAFIWTPDQWRSGIILTILSDEVQEGGA